LWTIGVVSLALLSLLALLVLLLLLTVSLALGLVLVLAAVPPPSPLGRYVGRPSGQSKHGNESENFVFHFESPFQIPSARGSGNACATFETLWNQCVAMLCAEWTLQMPREAACKVRKACAPASELATRQKRHARSYSLNCVESYWSREVEDCSWRAAFYPKLVCAAAGSHEGCPVEPAIAP